MLSFKEKKKKEWRNRKLCIQSILHTSIYIYYCIWHKQMSYMIYVAIMRNHYILPKYKIGKSKKYDNHNTNLHVLIWGVKRIVDRLLIDTALATLSLSLTEVNFTSKRGSKLMLRCKTAPIFLHYMWIGRNREGTYIVQNCRLKNLLYDCFT